jgi:hypothetical protein
MFSEENNIYSLDYYKQIDHFCKEKNLLNQKKYYEAYFWLLIGIGKFFIDKEKYPIQAEDFINLAIKNYNNENMLKIEDSLEMEHYKRIASDMRLGPIKKRIIIKDATASLNQIFMKKLGPKNQDSMNFVNLGAKREWYDTYLVTRDLFYESIRNNNSFKLYHDKNLFNSVLPRTLIKNMIMIIPYSAGDDLCLDNYITTIKDLKLSIEVGPSLKKLLKKFFKFIREDMQRKNLYKKTTTALMSKFSEDFETYRKYVLESDTGKADLSYYKMKKSTIDKRYVSNGEKRRVTKLLLIPSNALDKETFDTAIGANVAHFFDADEIRSIEKELGYSVITIHDSYLIDFNNCSKLTTIKINHYQEEINKITLDYTIGNIFIII